MRKVELKKESYVHIQSFMINELHLKGNELMVYAIIHGFSQAEDTWAECSLAYIAAWIGVNNKNTPINCINSLLEKGFIEKNETFKNGVKSCKYRAITPSDKKGKNFECPNKEIEQVSKNFEQVSKNDLRGVQNFCTPLNNIEDNIDNNTLSVERAESVTKKQKNSQIKANRMKEANALFEKLWSLYPLKKGKGQVSDTQKLRLLDIGYEELERAISRYIQYVDSVDYLHYKNGSTFFNSGYIDYLDANYVPEKEKKKEKKNTFQNFPQRDYDFEALERQLLLS